MSRLLAGLALVGAMSMVAGFDAPDVSTRKPPTATAPALAPLQPGFSGSAHDFYGPTAPLETRCAPCHAGEPTTRPYIWFREESAPLPHHLMDEAVRQPPAASTVLCLSCHDGTIASEIVGGGRDDDLIAFGSLVDASRDHPVGVRYPPLSRDRQKLRRDYAPIPKLMAEGIRLPAGRVECISCHDPHNALGVPAMLVKSDRRSALCLTCHVK